MPEDFAITTAQRGDAAPLAAFGGLELLMCRHAHHDR
jgi:hypothetical protein